MINYVKEEFPAGITGKVNVESALEAAGRYIVVVKFVTLLVKSEGIVEAMVGIPNFPQVLLLVVVLD